MKRSPFFAQQEIISPIEILVVASGSHLRQKSTFSPFSQPVLVFNQPAGAFQYTGRSSSNTELFLTLNCQNEVYEKDCHSENKALNRQVDIQAVAADCGSANPAAHAFPADNCPESYRTR
jgi:hypothetical protein